MKRAIDTNVLVYAHIAAMAEHAAVRRFLLDQLAAPKLCLVLSAGVLHEFVHIITDARRFDPPVTMPEALAVARGYLNRSNVECVSTDAESLELALHMLDHHRLGRKRIADTLLAATLITHGVQEIISCNAADFRVFTELRVIDPRA